MPRPAPAALAAAALLAGAALLAPAPSLADPTPTSATRPAMTETQKIEALIDVVRRTDAVFVRNGKTYDAASAAKLMRYKWKKHKADIATADDFIERAASKSLATGKAYRIRFPDGTETSSGDYLRRKLAAINGEPPATRPAK